jgi:hypothetical protein
MLTAQQHLAIFLHVGGYSNTEISNQLGVHPTTIRRWMRDPGFVGELKSEIDHAMVRARAQLQCAARRVADNVCAAARATQSLLLSDRTDPRIVVQCAKVNAQSLKELSRFLGEPSVVPVLEAEDPSLSKETQPSCHSMLSHERMTLAKLQEHYSKDDPEVKKLTEQMYTDEKEAK